MVETEPATSRTELKRTLSLGLVALYGLGTTIGAGIFVLIGKVGGAGGRVVGTVFRGTFRALSRERRRGGLRKGGAEQHGAGAERGADGRGGGCRRSLVVCHLALQIRDHQRLSIAGIRVPEVYDRRKIMEFLLRAGAVFASAFADSQDTCQT